MISAGLRCLVCQNQSIDDSNAPLAKDLRVIVRERLVAGDSDDAVRDYLVARYGEFILLKPPLNTGTILLWTATPAILAAALIVVFLRRRRPVRELADELTPEEARSWLNCWKSAKNSRLSTLQRIHLLEMAVKTAVPHLLRHRWPLHQRPYSGEA